MLLTLAVRHCGGALALRRPRAAPAATRWPRALPILRMASDVVPPPQLVDPEPGEEMIKQRAAAAKTGRNSAVVEQKKDQKSETDPLDLKPPRGTRDFYPDEYRIRQWLFSHFRASSRAFGFEEYDAPVLESEALYVRKAGEEVTQQLYSFADKGGRRVALRPEMTPSLARMVLARKPTPPVKWFSIPQCWRYERTTRGRRREHYQWNVDIWGVAGPAAEAEVLACAVDFFRRVGLTEADVGIKVNSRAVLGDMLRTTCGVDPTTEPSRFAACCVLVDKMEKVPPSALYGDFGALGVAADRVDALASLLEQGAAAGGSLQALESLLGADAGALEDLRMLLGLAEAYGFRDWLVVDASIVRGLAYYTGVVFEAFDRAGELRAICGGGRYDRLLELFGGDPQPAVGFGFGDAVVLELLEAKGLVPRDLAAGIDIVAFALATGDAAADAASARALAGVARELRAIGATVDLVLEPKKPKWAFKHADRRGARACVMLAPDEWARGDLVAKDLLSGDQAAVAAPDLPAWLACR
eukprot:CAMPEP_0119262360 /NCGR_PEP_ID=MMETSP1329-20130426/2114_1 /TAXON_ID=114041 /ORGANISM="Genus nov. species nov., Strain RCC1024" /LENGTH=527 /DNA_ID=CAMNT_0007261995 /DNA_START=167 /DNA_END=1750 /DNA_ORIENTATION=+